MSAATTAESYATTEPPKGDMAIEREKEGLCRTASTGESVAATAVSTTTSSPKGAEVKAGQTPAYVGARATSATTCAGFVSGLTAAKAITAGAATRPERAHEAAIC